MASKQRIERTRKRLRDRYLDNPACPGITGIGSRNGNEVLNYDETMPWLRWMWIQLTRWVAWQPIQMNKMRRPMAWQGRTERHQVVPAGVSVGQSPDVTAGTHGEVGKDKETGERGSCSNWHVYIGLSGTLGNPVVHPGLFDGSEFPKDHWANTTRFIPISFTQPNEVDAAWAVPLDQGRLADHFFESGPMPTTLIQFQVGDVAMTDTRNGLFEDGRVDQTDWEGDIGYGGENIARFVKQIIFHGKEEEVKCNLPFIPEFVCKFLCFIPGFCTGGREVFGGPGASGSCIRRQPHEAGARLFAGAGGANPITVGNDMGTFYRLLKLEL